MHDEIKDKKTKGTCFPVQINRRTAARLLERIGPNTPIRNRELFSDDSFGPYGRDSI
jgi:hypothetical protein